jgi:kinetochore protein NDC80
MMPPKNPAPAAPTGFVKDPRQLRDRGIQQSMWEDIVRWLRTSTSNFDTQGLKMSSVTGQSFRGIFEHLVLVADPEYAFPDPEVTREKGKWEPEFFGALNALGYPHVPNVDVKWLATPSAPYSWPTLLGVLHWIVEIGKVRTYFQTHNVHVMTNTME